MHSKKVVFHGKHRNLKFSIMLGLVDIITKHHSMIRKKPVLFNINNCLSLTEAVEKQIRKTKFELKLRVCLVQRKRKF